MRVLLPQCQLKEGTAVRTDPTYWKRIGLRSRKTALCTPLPGATDGSDADVQWSSEEVHRGTRSGAALTAVSELMHRMDSTE